MGVGSPVIAVDFDGTVCDHVFPGIGKPVPGALEWLRRLQSMGAMVILWTVRGTRHTNWATGERIGDLVSSAAKYLESNGVELYGVNENPGQKAWSDSPKAHADAFVDDLAIGTPLVHPPGFERPCVDWSKVGPMLAERLFPKLERRALRMRDILATTEPPRK